MSTQLHTNSESQGKDAVVDLAALAEESGVPLSFIKEELMLGDDSIDLESLRASMLKLINSTFLKS